MRIPVTLATGTALALSLAACGGGAEDTDAPAAEETVAAADPVDEADAMDDGETTDAADADMEDMADDEATGDGDGTGDAGDDAPTPAPSPTASAATKAAASAPKAAPSVAAVAATKPPIFAVCSACHSEDPGDNGIGPSLAGVFGAKAGHVGSFDYSDAMESSGLTWNEATLNRYLENPQGVVPGTSMSYNGLKNAQQRKAVVDYLKTL